MEYTDTQTPHIAHIIMHSHKRISQHTFTRAIYRKIVQTNKEEWWKTNYTHSQNTSDQNIKSGLNRFLSKWAILA